jgi:hypothetical protein
VYYLLNRLLGKPLRIRRLSWYGIVFIPALSWGQGKEPTASSETPLESCAKFRSLARAEASLLFAPKIGVQFLRLPKAGTISTDGTSEIGERNQIRAYVGYSVLDLYRGTVTLELGELDCKRATAEVELLEAIELGQSQGKEAAIRKALAFLDQRVERLKELGQEVARRFELGRITLRQLDDIRGDIELAKQKRLALLEDLSLIEAKSTKSRDSSSLSALVSAYLRNDLEREKSASRLRRTRAWDVLLRGGVIPTSDRDFFGALEITYNFGQPFQAAAEKEYLSARQREVNRSNYDPAQNATRVLEYQKRSIPILKEELSLREEALEQLLHHETVLRASDNVDVPNLLAEVEVRRILVEVDVVYFKELFAQRNLVVNRENYVDSK